MKKINIVFILYDYQTEEPKACLIGYDELTNYLGTSRASIRCSISRIKHNVTNHIEDKTGKKYKLYSYKEKIED